MHLQMSALIFEVLPVACNCCAPVTSTIRSIGVIPSCSSRSSTSSLERPKTFCSNVVTFSAISSVGISFSTGVWFLSALTVILWESKPSVISFFPEVFTFAGCAFSDVFAVFFEKKFSNDLSFTDALLSMPRDCTACTFKEMFAVFMFPPFRVCYHPNHPLYIYRSKNCCF